MYRKAFKQIGRLYLSNKQEMPKLETFIVKVIQEGRVTIPKKTRDKHNINTGDFVEMEVIRRINPTKEANPS